MAKHVSAEFVDIFEQLHYQLVEGAIINDKHVHFANKLMAMLKNDYKAMYELEKKEHEELRESLRPKTGWGSGNLTAVPTGFVGGEVVGFGKSEEPRVADCELHGPMERNNDPSKGGGALWYSPNNFGYSMYSPPCNGCKMGQRDAAKGLWMSGFGGTHNIAISRAAFQEPLPSPPHSPLVVRKEETCPPAPKKAPLGAALCATATGVSSFNSVGASAPLSPVDQIPDDHF